MAAIFREHIGGLVYAYSTMEAHEPHLIVDVEYKRFAFYSSH